jgi:hypothetical protein
LEKIRDTSLIRNVGLGLRVYGKGDVKQLIKRMGVGQSNQSINRRRIHGIGDLKVCISIKQKRIERKRSAISLILSPRSLP